MRGTEHAPIYSNGGWCVTAMTSGNISGSTTSLVSAFRWLNGSTNRIYLGDGVGSATSEQIFSDGAQQITALAFGQFGGLSPRLATAFDDGALRTVYTSDGTKTNLLWHKLYQSASWQVTSLAAGDVDADADDELVASFDTASRTQVQWGDGITESVGVTNGGQYYRGPN